MPRVTLDIVSTDPVHGESVLHLVEEGPWPEDDSGGIARLRELQDRLYNAVDAVVDGHLAARFPDLHGKPVRIQIDSPSGCPVRLQAFVRTFGEALAHPGEYREAIASCVFVSGLRVVTGHEMGRFQ